MQRLVAICLFAFVLSFGAERATPTISVLPFTDNNQGAAAHSYGKVIAAMFGTHLRNETNFIVLEQGSSQKAGALLSGSVSAIGSMIQIDVKLISANTNDVVVAEFAEINSQVELREAISKLAKIIEDKYLRQWMGDLQVTVVPTEGEVYLNEQFVGKSSLAKPLRLNNMLEGKYSLRVLAGGYQKSEQEIIIAPRTLQNVQVSLQSLPGSIRIESEPSNATVIINGQNMGNTPYSLASIAQGKYKVELQAENFQPYSRMVNVHSGQLTELKASMEVISGSLFVQSNPSNAQVFVDENFMGVTPLLLENVTPGTVSVALRLKGYFDHKEVVRVLPGQKAEVNAAINRQTGKLTLVSEQRDLSVKIKGETEITLEAPFHKHTLNAGQYQVTVSKPKYYDNVYTITIKPDEEYRLNTELSLKPGRISFIEAGKIPTDVFINNEYKGKSGKMTLELPEGEHEILVRNWFHEKRWKIQIYADKTEEISLQEFAQSSSFSSWWGVLAAALIAIPAYIAGDK